MGTVNAAEAALADQIRPRAFATAEERAPWTLAEDIARGSREQANRAATRAAKLWLQKATRAR